MEKSARNRGKKPEVRSKDAQSYRALYGTGRWKQVRRSQLMTEPLCRMCSEEGRVEPATVVDHIKPHKGNEALFFDPANLASLCAPHHNSVKQSEERTGKRIVARGLDGWPIEDA